jgi:hypothetical protein
MDYGEWTENSRGTYNKGDGVARSTVQVCIVLNYKQYFVIFPLQANRHSYLHFKLNPNWFYGLCNLFRYIQMHGQQC